MFLHRIGCFTVTHKMYSCNVTVRKKWWTHKKHVFVYFSLTYLKVVVGESGTEYENWIDCICRSKKNMWWREKERSDRRWTIFLASCCSSNVFVRWFHCHSSASGVRPLFGADPKMRLCNFLHLLISSLAGVQCLVFTSSHLSVN